MDTGNTLSLLLTKSLTTVHPRGYGEHESEPNKFSRKGGSSPWIRGTLGLDTMNQISNRFIPVDTGNTARAAILMIISAVHPRGYGEHNQALYFCCATYGSSPWIRGTHIYLKKHS